MAVFARDKKIQYKEKNEKIEMYTLKLQIRFLHHDAVLLLCITYTSMLSVIAVAIASFSSS